MEIVLPASELSNKGDRRVQALDAGVVAGAHTGSGTSINPKLWTCEDSLSVWRLPGGECLACVADAHWGGLSGETVAREVRQAWDGATADGVEARLREALASIERGYLEANPRDPSETTVLLAYLEGRTLTWLSVGDSLLLRLGRTCRLLNRQAGFFFGGAPLVAMPEDAIETASCEVEPGDVVLLASDGLEPQASALDRPDVLRVMTSPAPLERRVEHLLALANDPERDGGRDNLALVAIAVA